MEVKKEKGKLVDKEDLKEIILSDDSNIILPQVSLPSTYQAQGEIKYGAKYRASEQDLADYRKRVSRDAILTSDEIKTLLSDTNERRRALQQSITEQKEQYMQRRNTELQLRQAKQREEARANRIANENDTQRSIRIAAEEEVKTNRAREIQALENRCRREKEQVETFFLQSSNKFNERYGNPTLRIKVSGETGIDRIITSRPFSTNRYAHRCFPCGYHNPESLSISKIYLHLFENKDKHMSFVLSEIDNYYNAKIQETRRKHIDSDNQDLKQQRISRELEGLNKLRGAKYR
jgi:hypothetical protein